MGKPGAMFLVETIKAKPLPRGSSLFDRMAESRLPMPESLREALLSRRAPIDRRGNALDIFRSLGPEAEVTLPSLVREYNAMVNAGEIMPDWDVIEALVAVGDLKAKYVPDFIKALRNRWEPTALDGAYLLGSIGPKAKAAVPVLLEQMPAGGWQFSNVVAEALWKIDRQTNLALGVFTNELLTVRDKQVSLESLREMGPAGKPAARLVLQQLTNSDDRVRTAAAKALSAIDPAIYQSTIGEMNQNPAASVERLTQAIRGTVRERIKALAVIAMYGPDAAPAVPALIEVLQRAPPTGVFLPGMQWEDAVNAVGKIGPGARSAVPALIALLPAKRYDINASEICRSLGNIGPGATSAVPVLKQILQGSNQWHRLAAATALARIVPEEKAYQAPILMGLTNFSYPTLKGSENLGKDPRFAWPAKVALWRLGLEKEPPIGEMMPSAEAGHQLAAIPLLGDIGPPAKAALPYLEKILDSDQDIHFRRMAAIAIRKIDPQEAAKLHLPGILALPQ
jgi:HEAT repeat protein